MKKAVRLLAVSAILFVLCGAQISWSQVTVILTRHAEKASTPKDNPPLNPAGEKRAELLATMLADSGVNAIYVTELLRTQRTAAPLAALVHVKPTVIPADDTEGLVKAIRARQSGVVVVVGHSNRLPAIITALGGPSVQIPETQYDNLYVLTLGAAGSSLLRLHYGNTKPVPAARQHGTQYDGCSDEVMGCFQLPQGSTRQIHLSAGCGAKADIFSSSRPASRSSKTIVRLSSRRNSSRTAWSNNSSRES